MLHKGVLKFDNNYAILDENNRADMMSFRKQKKLMILRYLVINNRVHVEILSPYNLQVTNSQLKLVFL